MQEKGEKMLIDLPTYPATGDVWERLKEETRPIVIYGMGNGTDKLIARFEKYGIRFADIFASDGFVRGHDFHGVRVKTLAEIEALYPEFVIVLSFASNREEVLSLFVNLDSKYELIIPDMPVARDAYFTHEFYNENYDKIRLAYECLADELSKNLYASILHFKLYGKLSYLLSYTSHKTEIYSLLKQQNIETVLDGGAYNGDTAREFLCEFSHLKKILAVEPDPKTFKRLLKFVEKYNIENPDNSTKILPLNMALSCEDGELFLNASGNRNTSLNGASYEHKSVPVPIAKIDTLLSGKGIDFIKLDVEGEEQNALFGAERTIDAYHPALLISLYHASEDIFSLVLYMRERFPLYRLFLRRVLCVPAWEIDLIALAP